VSTLPSFNLYRGSLLALLIATAVALWLLVRPPGSGDGEEVIISDATPTAIATEAPTDEAETPEEGTPTVGATTTPGTPAPEATPTAGPQTYTVVDGDTLLGIAERFAPAGVDALTYAQQIAAASGLASVDTPINPGQTLVLP
jgi:LysM repeat protein